MTNTNYIQLGYSINPWERDFFEICKFLCKTMINVFTVHKNRSLIRNSTEFINLAILFIFETQFETLRTADGIKNF